MNQTKLYISGLVHYNSPNTGKLVNAEPKRAETELRLY
jgi:hypothetical protein